jgi:hypothetical protein
MTIRGNTVLTALLRLRLSNVCVESVVDSCPANAIRPVQRREPTMLGKRAAVGFAALRVGRINRRGLWPFRVCACVAILAASALRLTWAHG